MSQRLNLNVKLEDVKLLENTQENLCDLGFWENLLSMIPKAQSVFQKQIKN